MATFQDADDLEETGAHQYDEFQKSTDTTNSCPYETAWKDFNIRLKWNANHSTVGVGSDLFGHPCKFQYAFSYEKQRIEKTFKEENIKISPDFQNTECLSIDITSKRYKSSNDAAGTIKNLFIEQLFSDYEVITLSTRSKKCQKLTEALPKSHQCQDVVGFLDKSTKFMYFVGHKDVVDEFLREQNIEMVQTSIMIDSDTWKRLSPEQKIKEAAFVDIVSIEEGVRISGERDEVIIARLVINDMEAGISVDDVVFDKIECNRLLIVNGEINQCVYAFFKKTLQVKGLEVFSEMSVENHKAVVRLSAKSNEVVEASCKVIKKSIVELVLDYHEAQCVQKDLKVWTERSKLKSTKTRTMQNIVCTSDVANVIYQTVCDIDIPLPDLLCDYLTSFGEEVLMNLKSDCHLDVEFCPSQQIVKLHGCLDKVKDFRKQIHQFCTFITTVQLRTFVEMEPLITQIVNLHESKINVEVLSEDASCSFKNCTLEAEWHLHGCAENTMKVSLIEGDINNLDLNRNACKLQFVNKKFISWQERRMKQHDYLHKQQYAYMQTENPAMSVVWNSIKGLPVIVADEWMVEVAVSKFRQLSQRLSDVFREAAKRKCLCVVIPLELIVLHWGPSRIACACIEVLAGIHCPFEVIFLCHKKKSVVDVVKHAEYLYKKNDTLLCIREFICPDLIPSSGLSSIFVTIQEDDITAVEVDVIVNTVDRSLNLSQGYLSSSILKYAGKKIQEECKTKYNNRIQFGEIAVTSAGNMQHNLILHCALPKFEKHTVTYRVKSMVKKCLIEADRRQYRSIAFPAFGTGKLGYSPRETAHAMLEAIEEYKKQALNSCLEKVVICVSKFSNDDICKVFNNEHIRRRRRFLSTVGNGIDNCRRLSCSLGNGIKTVQLNVIAVEDKEILPAYFVIVKQKLHVSASKIDLQFDEKSSHDSCEVVLSDDFYHDIKEAIKYLCIRKVFDIAIDLSDTEYQDLVVSSSLDKIIGLLEGLMKESEKNNCILPLQNVVVLAPDKYISLQPAQSTPTNFLSSSLRYFSVKPAWYPHTAPYKKFQFTIFGQSASQVKRKLTTLLDTDIMDFEVIERTDVDLGVESDNTEQPVSQDVKKITSDNSQASKVDMMLEDMMTAEINPGIVHIVRTLDMFTSWRNDKEMSFESKGNSVLVKGPFEKVLLFEKFLEDTINGLDEKDGSDVSSSSLFNMHDTSEGNESDNESTSNNYVNNLDDCDGSSGDSLHNSNDEPYINGKTKSHVKGNIEESGTGQNDSSYSTRHTCNQGCSNSSGKQSPREHKEEIKSTEVDIVDIYRVKPMLTFKFKRFEVSLVGGDVSRLRVDCLINSANKHLKESYGVSKALSIAGGKPYNDAVDNAKEEYGGLSAGSCIDTEPGHLPCKRVIHAVGPKASSSQDEQELLKILQDTVRSCLKMADELKCTSVALPIIGCGAGKISEENCAVQYCHAFDAFPEHCGFLKYVYIVEINPKRLENMAAIFENMIFVKHEQEFLPCAPYGRVSLLLLETNLLTRIRADAIICIKDITNDGGLVPNMLLKEGGEKYVEEHSALKQKYLKQREDLINHVFELKYSKLQYKYVLFSSISKSSNIALIVKEAIVKAIDRGCQSVHIPIVGEKENGTRITNTSMCDGVVKGLKLCISDASHSSRLEIKVVCQTEAMFQCMKSKLIESKVFAFNSRV